MRIWSLHPKLLDRAGLVAAWRETLLAQAVLAGETQGYKHHPQLIRFQKTTDPLATIGAYLSDLYEDATARGYNFDYTKIRHPRVGKERVEALTVTRGQLEFEWQHLGKKLTQRSPELLATWEATKPKPHPIFEVVPGSIESFERV